MNKEFRKELEESGMIRFPLPLHREREFEARFAAAEIEESAPLTPRPTAEGAAEAAGLCADGNGYTVSAPLRCDPWPRDTPGDVGYRNFGVARLVFRFPEEAAEDWTRFDRLRFSVKPVIEGARVFHLNAAIVSCGKIPVPDRYWREGATVFDLDGGVWNDCIWEFGTMPRGNPFLLLPGSAAGAGEQGRKSRALSRSGKQHPHPRLGKPDPRDPSLFGRILSRRPENRRGDDGRGGLLPDRRRHGKRRVLFRRAAGGK